MDKRKKLATLSIMYQGDWDKIAKALQDDVQAMSIKKENVLKINEH